MLSAMWPHFLNLLRQSRDDFLAVEGTSILGWLEKLALPAAAFTVSLIVLYLRRGKNEVKTHVAQTVTIAAACSLAVFIVWHGSIFAWSMVTATYSDHQKLVAQTVTLHARLADAESGKSLLTKERDECRASRASCPTPSRPPTTSAPPQPCSLTAAQLAGLSAELSEVDPKPGGSFWIHFNPRYVNARPIADQLWALFRQRAVWERWPLKGEGPESTNEEIVGLAYRRVWPEDKAGDLLAKAFLSQGITMRINREEKEPRGIIVGENACQFLTGGVSPPQEARWHSLKQDAVETNGIYANTFIVYPSHSVDSPITLEIGFTANAAKMPEVGFTTGGYGRVISWRVDRGHLTAKVEHSPNIGPEVPVKVVFYAAKAVEIVDIVCTSCE